MESGKLETKTEIAVMTAIFVHINGGAKGTGKAHVGLTEIARKARCNRNNAAKAVKRLVGLGFLTEYPPGTDGWPAKTYQMSLPLDLAEIISLDAANRR
jgi:hypothetical protein